MADIILKNKVYENIDTVFLPSKGGEMVKFSEGSGGDVMPTPSFTLEEGTADADGLSRSGLVRTTGLSYMEGGIDAGGIAGFISELLNSMTDNDFDAIVDATEKAKKLVNNTVITKLKDTLKECAAVGIHYPKYTVHIRLTADALQSLFDVFPIAGLDAHHLDKQVESLGKLWEYAKLTSIQPMIDDAQSTIDDSEASEDSKKNATANKNLFEWLIDTVDSLIAAGKELLADDGVEVINVLLPEFQTSWAGLVNTVLPIVVKEWNVLSAESDNQLDMIVPLVKNAVHALLGGLGGTFEPALFAYQVLGELNAVGLLKQILSSSSGSSSDSMAEMISAIINAILYTKGMEIQVTAIAGGFGKVPSAQSDPMTISRSMLVYDEKETLCEAKTVTLKAGGKTLNCSEGVSKVGDGVMFCLPEVPESIDAGFVYPESKISQSGSDSYTISSSYTSKATLASSISVDAGTVRYVKVTAQTTGTYEFSIGYGGSASIDSKKVRLYVCSDNTDDFPDILAYSKTDRTVKVFLASGTSYTVRWQLIAENEHDANTSYAAMLYYRFASSGNYTSDNTLPNDMQLKLYLTKQDSSILLVSVNGISGSDVICFTVGQTETTTTLSCDSSLINKWDKYGVQVDITLANTPDVTYTGKVALTDMKNGAAKLFDRTFTEAELVGATATAVFAHGVGVDYTLHFSHFYRLGDFSMEHPEVIGEEVPGTFDLEHRLVTLSADKNGMFRAFEQEIEKAPTPVIQLHMGATNEMLTLKNDQNGYKSLAIVDGVAGESAESGYDLTFSALGGKHSVQQRLYGENIALGDASNAVEVTTAAITSLSENWTLSGAVKTAVAPAAITDDDDQPGEHRVVMNDDWTCTIVEPTAECQCKFVKKTDSTSDTGTSTNSSTDETTEETVVYPTADSILVLRGSYSFVDSFNSSGDGSGMPSGDLYENYTYDAATGTFTFPDLREDVYIFVKGE